MLKQFIKWTGFAVLGVALALIVYRAPVLAVEIDGGNYDDNDYNKIVAFLNQPSAVKGKTNGDVLGWDIDNPETWVSKNGGTISEITWNESKPKRVCSVDIWDWDYKVKSSILSGDLDLSNMTALTDVTIITETEEVMSLNVNGCLNLIELDCRDMGLAKLDVSTNKKLKKLRCDGNRLTSLDVSKNTRLVEFDCSDNRLTSLDVSKNTRLVELGCSRNKLTRLDVSNNTRLMRFSCSRNKLTKLNLSKNKRLVQIECEQNKLTKLNLSKNIKLEDLYCRSNPLSYLTAKIDGKKITLKANGKGYVGFEEGWVYAKPKKGAKFVNWTQKGKVVSKKKSFLLDINKSYNLVANFK